MGDGASRAFRGMPPRLVLACFQRNFLLRDLMLQLANLRADRLPARVVARAVEHVDAPADKSPRKRHEIAHRRDRDRNACARREQSAEKRFEKLLTPAHAAHADWQRSDGSD